MHTYIIVMVVVEFQSVGGNIQYFFLHSTEQPHQRIFVILWGNFGQGYQKLGILMSENQLTIPKINSIFPSVIFEFEYVSN